MERMLIHLIKRAKLVIIGRMTPQQKAQICTIARKHMKSKIMAMGDGQNDSPMI
jgi:P-type E1-E2 ATPase